VSELLRQEREILLASSGPNPTATATATAVVQLLNRMNRHRLYARVVALVERQLGAALTNDEDVTREYAHAREELKRIHESAAARLGHLTTAAAATSTSGMASVTASQSHPFASGAPTFPSSAGAPFTQGMPSHPHSPPQPQPPPLPFSIHPHQSVLPYQLPLKYDDPRADDRGRARTSWITLIAAVALWFMASYYDLFGKLDLPTHPLLTMAHPVASEIPDTKLKDVIGCDEAVQEVFEVVEYLKDPSRFSRLGGRMPKGILLLGPPGVGKTLLARAVAGEAGVPFFSANGSQFEEKYVGVGPKRVRQLFAAAAAEAPAIIFIDEIDSMAGKRSPDDPPHEHETLHQLLVELDGFRENRGLIVMAATNYADRLDEALTRPGRFDRHVVINPPDIKGRRQLLEHYGKGLILDPHVDFSKIARGTIGLTGADLAQLLNIASLRAASTSKSAVTNDDIEYAKDRVMMGLEKRTTIISPDLRKHIAFYEAGKALSVLHTPHALPLHKVTILQRGDQLGLTSILPSSDYDIVDQSYEEMLAVLDVRLGGRVAEELTFGLSGVSNKSVDDLHAANDLARAMIMRFGFGKKHGPVSDAAMDMMYHEGTSETHKESIDHEVNELLAAAYQRVRQRIEGRRDELRRIAEALLRYEVLNANQVKMVAQGKDISASMENEERGSTGGGSNSQSMLLHLPRSPATKLNETVATTPPHQ